MPYEYDPDALHEAEADIRNRLSGSPVDLEVQRTISNLYRAASVVSRRAEREILSDIGLSWSAFVSLWVLWVWGEMDATRLANEVGLTPGTVTGVRKGLEKQGLVENRRGEDDGRMVFVRLTAEGDRAAMEYRQVRVASLRTAKVDQAHDGLQRTAGCDVARAHVADELQPIRPGIDPDHLIGFDVELIDETVREDLVDQRSQCVVIALDDEAMIDGAEHVRRSQAATSCAATRWCPLRGRRAPCTRPGCG